MESISGNFQWTYGVHRHNNRFRNDTSTLTAHWPPHQTTCSNLLRTHQTSIFGWAHIVSIGRLYLGDRWKLVHYRHFIFLLTAQAQQQVRLSDIVYVKLCVCVSKTPQDIWVSIFRSITNQQISSCHRRNNSPFNAARLASISLCDDRIWWTHSSSFQ